MKKFILGLLILSTLLSLTIICNATLIADQLIDIPAEEEIMPMMARKKCSRNMYHYEPTYWPNGNIKTITYYLVNRVTGLDAGYPHDTSDFPETGPNVLTPFGTNNGFWGCFCPNCEGIYIRE